jgi:hypothetical protein
MEHCIVQPYIRFRHIFTILIACSITEGCFSGAWYYIPSRMPTPEFDSTSDTYLAGAFGTGGFQADIVATPADHVWMAGHFTFLSLTDSIDATQSPGMGGPVYWSSLGHIYGEFGVGWYSDRQHGLIAGYGRGWSSFIREVTRNRSSRDTTTYPPEVGRGEFENYFLQASTAPMKVNADAYARLLLRGEYVRFRQFSANRKDLPLPSAVLLEPRILLGTQVPDTPDLLFEIQIGFQVRMDDGERFDYLPVQLSLALIGLFDVL